MPRKPAGRLPSAPETEVRKAVKSSSRIRVLCVDDCPDIIAALELVFGIDGTMECIGGLRSANKLVGEVQRHSPPPDVVVLDATMPGMNPLEALRQLVTTCPLTRTIIYSGCDDPELVDLARTAGAWGYVSKGAEPTVLLDAVREVASGSTVFPQYGRRSG